METIEVLKKEIDLYIEAFAVCDTQYCIVSEGSDALKIDIASSNLEEIKSVVEYLKLPKKSLSDFQIPIELIKK